MKLTGLGPDVIATNTTLIAPLVLSASFDLRGVLPGVRTVDVTNPDGTSITIPNGFTIEQGGQPRVSINIIGLSEIRIGRPQTYYVALQNLGNVDAGPNAVLAQLPSSIEITQSGEEGLLASGLSSSPTEENARTQAKNAVGSSSSGRQTATFITQGVPAAQTQYAQLSITYPFDVGVSDFTITGNQLRDVEDYPAGFDDYAKEHRAAFPLLLISLSTTCVPQANSALSAYLHASSAYSALKSAQDDVTYKYASILAAGALVITQSEAVEALRISEVGGVVLDHFITLARECLQNNIDDEAHQACLPDVDRLIDEVKTGALELLAQGAGKAVATLATVAAAAVPALSAENVDELNRLVLVRKSANDNFQTVFNDYTNALSQFSSCSGYVPPPAPNPFGITLTVSPVFTLDPNDKIGPLGFGNQRFIGTNAGIVYDIVFTNKATATAPVQTAVVTDVLPAGVFNLNLLSFGPITIQGHVVNPPPYSIHGFTTISDLRPNSNVLLRIDAQIDTETEAATWTFTSLDPATGQPVSDPQVGFLPPGAEGSVSVEVTLNPVASGTKADNKATVVFDVNPSITTPTWSNTIDSSSPASRVAPLTALQGTECFRPQWSGSDIGSGLATFNVFVSDNGGPFIAWQLNTTASSAVFNGQPGHSYAFYSQATDFVGNVEAPKHTPDATTMVAPGASCNGRPTLTGSVTTKSLKGTTETLALQFTNNGVGDAMAALNQISFHTLSGTGLVSLMSPAVPISLGSLVAGATATITLELNVPPTVKEFSIAETGILRDVAGNNDTFSIGQAVFP